MSLPALLATRANGSQNSFSNAASGWLAAQGIGWAVRDVMLTRDEIEGLMAGLLYVEGAPPAGQTRLTDWAREHASELGVRYASELARRRDRQKSYEELK